MLYVLAAIIVIILGTFVYAGMKGAPWVPTWKQDVDRFLNLAQIKPGEKFYDLGCGDGRLVKAAAQAGAVASGFEVSLIPYLMAKLKQLSSKVDYKIRFKNFWETDLSEADIVYVFLMEKIYPRLKEKLEKELKPGARIITYVWPIAAWPEINKDETSKQPTLYLYQR